MFPYQFHQYKLFIGASEVPKSGQSLVTAVPLRFFFGRGPFALGKYLTRQYYLRRLIL